MERNPYAPPTASLASAVEPPTAEEIASRGQRFANMLIDFVGYVVLAVLVGAVMSIVAPSLSASLSASGILGNYLFSIVLTALYYLPFELFFARTPGKLVTRTRVVTESGDTPTFRHILIRTLVRFVPFEAFSFFRSSVIGWHDDWSHTRVVRIRRTKGA